MDANRYAIFRDDKDGPVWREFSTDLITAKINAQRLADAEQLEFFVFDFEDISEVARLFPSRNSPTPI